MLNYPKLLELGLSPDLPTLQKRVVGLSESIGFGLVSGVMIRGRLGTSGAKLNAFGNAPAAYLETMNSASEGLKDPLLGKLLARPGHASYDQSFYVEAGAADLWDNQAPFGYRAGLAISLHQPSHAEAFLLGVDGTTALPSGVIHLRLQAAMQMLALHAQAAFERILKHEAAAPEPELDRKERIALQLAGATIVARRGNLVGVSTAGNPSLGSAARKLGASTITAAILRGIDGGHIQP